MGGDGLGGSAGWDSCAWGHPFSCKAPKWMSPMRARGLTAAFTQGRVQKGAKRVPWARDERGWRGRRHPCRRRSALEQDGEHGSAGMGVTGWDNTGGPRSLCPALEGTAPGWWRASAGGTHPQPGLVG